MKFLDMTGKACPIPVVTARKALQAGEETVRVDVDNHIAVQNLEKLANGEGYAFTFVKKSDTLYSVLLHDKGGAASPDVTPTDHQPTKGAMTVVIGTECMGSGADELGRILMKGFVFSLTELDPPPARVICLNGGAKLTTADAATVPDLQTLAGKGTEIYTCGTCASYYGIADALAVGSITDMMNIVRMMSEAGRLVTI